MGKKALVVQASKLADFFCISESERVERLVRINSENGKFSNSSKHGLFDLPTMLADRSWCESDPSVVQIIPYVTLWRYKNGVKELFTYKRGKAGGEGRLHDLYSVGVGGHVEDMPNAPIEDLRETLYQAAIREIQEEIGETIVSSLDVRAAIYRGFNNATVYLDTRTEVESVHLGIMMNVELDPHDHVFTLEDEVIEDVRWVALPELKRRLEENEHSIENWSKVVIRRFAVN